MIIVWDCKTGRCEFIEMLLKKEGYEVFSCSEVNPELLEQIQSLEPKLIIASEQISSQLDLKYDKWVLGKDISLPLEPLDFLESISKIFR